MMRIMTDETAHQQQAFDRARALISARSAQPYDPGMVKDLLSEVDDLTPADVRDLVAALASLAELLIRDSRAILDAADREGIEYDPTLGALLDPEKVRSRLLFYSANIIEKIKKAKGIEP
jgi:hypothetical protein